MTAQRINLIHGWKVGDQTYKFVEMRTPNAFDVIESSYESERPVTPEGGEPSLAPSPTLTAYNLLRRVITQIGDMKDPAPVMAYFKGLHPDDYVKLIDESQSLAYGKAVSDAVRARGRIDPPSPDPGGGGGDDLGGDGMDEGGS